MKKLSLIIFMSLVLAVTILSWGVDQGSAQSPKSSEELIYKGKITPAEKKAAAARAKALGLKPGVAGTAPAGPQPGTDSANTNNEK
jgi:hypothetical protein